MHHHRHHRVTCPGTVMHHHRHHRVTYPGTVLIIGISCESVPDVVNISPPRQTTQTTHHRQAARPGADRPEPAWAEQPVRLGSAWAE